MRFVPQPGNCYDSVGLARLIASMEYDGLSADKAFDSNHTLADLCQRGRKLSSRILGSRNLRVLAQADQDAAYEAESRGDGEHRQVGYIACNQCEYGRGDQP